MRTMETVLSQLTYTPQAPPPAQRGAGCGADHLESITPTNRSFIKQRVTFHSAALRWDRQRQPDYSRSYSRTREVPWFLWLLGHQKDQQLDWEHWAETHTHIHTGLMLTSSHSDWLWTSLNRHHQHLYWSLLNFLWT